MFRRWDIFVGLLLVLLLVPFGWRYVHSAGHLLWLLPAAAFTALWQGRDIFLVFAGIGAMLYVAVRLFIRPTV